MNDSEWAKIWSDSDSKWSADVSANGAGKDVFIVVEKSEDGFEAKTFFGGKEYSSGSRPCESSAVLLLLHRIIADKTNGEVIKLDGVRRNFDWHDDPPTYEEAVQHNEDHCVWGPISNWMVWCPIDQTVFAETVKLDVTSERHFSLSLKSAVDQGAAGWCAANINGDKTRWPIVNMEKK